MLKKIVMTILSLTALLVIGVQAYDKAALERECKELKGKVLQLRKEADAEKQIWSTMYKDCVDEKNVLISRLKEASTTQSGGSSK